MRTAALALGSFLLLATGAAHADSNSDSKGLCALLQPCKAPAEYSAGPFVKKPEIHLVPTKSISEACGVGSAQVHGHGGALGCASLNTQTCTVYLPKEIQALSPELFALIKNHELAHCRGWDHPRY